jgi:hypothetical protein
MSLSIYTRHTHILRCSRSYNQNHFRCKVKYIRAAARHAQFAPHRSPFPDTDRNVHTVSKNNGQMELPTVHINPLKTKRICFI